MWIDIVTYRIVEIGNCWQVHRGSVTSAIVFRDSSLPRCAEWVSKNIKVNNGVSKGTPSVILTEEIDKVHVLRFQIYVLDNVEERINN